MNCRPLSVIIVCGMPNFVIQSFARSWQKWMRVAQRRSIW